MRSNQSPHTAIALAIVWTLGAVACSREPVWQEEWTLVGTESPPARFGLTWADEKRTRGEYGFTFGPANAGDTDGWQVRGTLTADHRSPDYCGRAKWPDGSTCTIFKLWPRGSAPSAQVQQQLDALGLPDRMVQTYVFFEDGRTRRFSLLRSVPGAPETVWEHTRPAP